MRHYLKTKQKKSRMWIISVFFVLTLLLWCAITLKTEIHSGQSTILHVSHRGGGVERYFTDLQNLFPSHHHVVHADGTAISRILKRHEGKRRRGLFLHVHATMLDNGVGWGIIDIAKSIKRQGGCVMTTIHDFMWFLNDDPNNMAGIDIAALVSDGIKAKTRTFFSLCDAVIFPSNWMFQQYIRILGTLQQYKVHVAPHPDYPIDNTANWVAKFDSGTTLKVGFFGEFSRRKGAARFLGLLHALKNLGHKVDGHVYGHVNGLGASELELAARESSLHLHGRYKEGSIINLLRGENLHFIALLSSVNESYCYAATQALNTGIPIVHSGAGALSERLAPFAQTFDLSTQPTSKVINRLLSYIRNHSGQQISAPNISTESINAGDWYTSNYPELCAKEIKK